jgi:hypothetical protein
MGPNLVPRSLYSSTLGYSFTGLQANLTPISLTLLNTLPRPAELQKPTLGTDTLLCINV